MKVSGHFKWAPALVEVSFWATHLWLCNMILDLFPAASEIFFQFCIFLFYLPVKILRTYQLKSLNYCILSVQTNLTLQICAWLETGPQEMQSNSIDFSHGRFCTKLISGTKYLFFSPWVCIYFSQDPTLY